MIPGPGCKLKISESFASFAQLVESTQTSLVTLKKEWEDVNREITELKGAILDGVELVEERNQLLKDVRGMVDKLVKDMTAKIDSEEKAKMDKDRLAKKALITSLKAMDI